MIFDMYCDESYQDLLINPNDNSGSNGPQYTLFGGLKLPQNNREYLKNEIKDIRIKHSIFNEFKWDNVSPNKLDFYIDLIDLFFAHQDLYFKVILIDAKVVDHDKYNDSDQELGYYKFYYILIKNWIRNNSDEYFVFLDQKTNKNPNRLHELKRITNLVRGRNPIKIMQEINSKESDLLQLQNIIMGAVAYKFNQTEGTSEAKKSLISHIENKLQREIAQTPWSEEKFNVFFPDLERRYR